MHDPDHAHHLTEAHFADLLFNTAAVPVPVTRHIPTRTQIHP